MQTENQQAGREPLVRDRVENFNGQQLLYIGWDHHTMICAPIVLPVTADLTFGELVNDILPETAFAMHPDWDSINWDKVEWFASDEPFSPELDRNLGELGLGHKCFIRMKTPGLTGIAGTGS